MHMTISQFLVWLIIGALAGNVVGRLVTLRKEGLGFWTNILTGMAGAVVGGVIFRVFSIDLGLGDLKIDGEDLVSAFVGSLLCVIGWKIFRKKSGKAAERAS
jgi:uncharacterized membrane protein YeaQ/YmgE (transglycosylase-associated protein family)